MKKWKELLQDGISEATKKMSDDGGGSDMESCSSSSTSAYVSAYKGQSGPTKEEEKEVIEN
eukprot:4822361-Ditylum_brightwellii.AAC.1